MFGAFSGISQLSTRQEGFVRPCCFSADVLTGTYKFTPNWNILQVGDVAQCNFVISKDNMVRHCQRGRGLKFHVHIRVK